MKKCVKCGTEQSDERIFCIDCNTRLGDSLSPEIEKFINEQNTKIIDRLYSYGNDLRASYLDKVVGVASIAGILISLVFCMVKQSNKEYEAFMVFFFAACIFNLSALFALVPQLLWSMEKRRLSNWAEGTEELSPSSLYKTMRKLGIWICFIVGVICVAVTIRSTAKEPEPTPSPYEYSMVYEYYSSETVYEKN